MNDTDRELVRRLKSGDKAACAECVEQHSAPLYRLALRLMGDASEAEDVMQETFINAFRGMDAFDGRSELSTWLYRITYNNALMRLRRKQPEKVSVDEYNDLEGEIEIPKQLFDWCCLPEVDFESSETREQLEKAIQELPQTLKATFIMREVEGLSTEETAQTLEVSEAVVKTRLHPARLRLRERLSIYFAELTSSHALIQND